MALRLARRGYGLTSPNPMVGAVLVKRGKIVGRGWHHAAGHPHAEIEAIRDAQSRGNSTRGATLYVTLEPCSTYGRTPPCTDAIISAQIKKVVAASSDFNPQHCGRGFDILRRAGIEVVSDVLREECEALNEAFNYWIVHRTPFVTVKAAMTLDGKIATASGESKWITSEEARAYGMELRAGTDAILVGINTVLADDPGLTVRDLKHGKRSKLPPATLGKRQPRRIILDAMARTPIAAKILTGGKVQLTTIVVSKNAPQSRVAALKRRGAHILVGASVPSASHRSLDLNSLLKVLGRENVTSLLVEGGGEVNASFLRQGLAQRVAFFYAPKVLGGRDSIPGVGGSGARTLNEAVQLKEIKWREIGSDLLLRAKVSANSKSKTRNSKEV